MAALQCFLLNVWTPVNIQLGSWSVCTVPFDNVFYRDYSYTAGSLRNPYATRCTKLSVPGHHLMSNTYGSMECSHNDMYCTDYAAYKCVTIIIFDV